MKRYLDRPLVVEGKYDKNTLSQLFDGIIIPTGGFGIFRKTELVAYLKKLAQPNGLLVLTDSDAGGHQIRRFLVQTVGKDKVTHLYIPQIEGKEKRKNKASAQGWLGVEGMDKDTLLGLLSPFTVGAPPRPALVLTKADMYALGLSGGVGSAERRDTLAHKLDLPLGLTPNAWLEAVTTLVSKEQWENALATLQKEENHPPLK